jgi:hypothetical protein
VVYGIKGDKEVRAKQDDKIKGRKEEQKNLTFNEKSVDKNNQRNRENKGKKQDYLFYYFFSPDKFKDHRKYREQQGGKQGETNRKGNKYRRYQKEDRLFR